MRVQQPQQFDDTQDYPIGRRVVFNGQTLIVEPFSHKEELAAIKYAGMWRCLICGVQPVCKRQIKCHQWERSDRKQVFFKIMKLTPEQQHERVLSFVVMDKLRSK